MVKSVRVILAEDVPVRGSNGFVTVPAGTTVNYEFERRVKGLTVTHTVHKFRCLYKGESLVHITVCEQFQRPSWMTV